jgi:CRP-like cAMP-binding protein
MPKPFQYSNGSLIYGKGEDADKIYILQSGKVSLVFANVETGEDVRNQVEPGEFFGVKSALGRFPREENAITLADSVLMVFTVPEFEKMAMANTRIILKMLKVFSNQMRKTHAQVSSLLDVEEVKPDEGLFAIGEKYLKNQRYAHAKYIFSRYLAHYPSGARVKEATKNIRLADAALAKAAGKTSTHDETPEADEPPPPPPSEPSANDEALTKAYYDALNLILQQKYQEAMEEFNQIIDANESPEWTEKSDYEVGHCLFLLNKFEECIKHYTKFLAQYKESPDIRDAMFYIGQSFEKTGNKDQAIVWYQKNITLSGAEKDPVRTKALKALNELKKRK